MWIATVELTEYPARSEFDEVGQQDAAINRARAKIDWSRVEALVNEMLPDGFSARVEK